MNEIEQDQIWKALSDPTRRKILGLLTRSSKTTTEIVESFPDLTRFNVMKHLDVLRTAELVLTKEDGRKRINSINSKPITEIHQNWLSEFAEGGKSKPKQSNDGIEVRAKRISKRKKIADFGWKRYD